MAGSSAIQSPEKNDNLYCPTPLVSMALKFAFMLNLIQEVKDDLKCWISLDRHLLPDSPIHPRIPDMTIKSSASNVGWGTQQGELQAGIRWSMSKASNHIKYLELLAAYLALQCSVKQKYSIKILLKMDNVTAVMCINKMWGTQFAS